MPSGKLLPWAPQKKKKRIAIGLGREGISGRVKIRQD